ncbi:Diguanylate cyclase DgcM [Burkholderiaceae bacterium]|nr:Diguanylate cyclase DgcM [Burkholderiaceae bacterium]
MASDRDHQDKLQQHRMQMTKMSVVNYAFESVVLALYGLTGAAPGWVAIAFFLVAVGSSMGFWAWIRLGWNLRLKDPGMLVPQIVGSWIVQFAFLAIAPQLALVFLVSLLVGFNYAMMSFDGRQFMAAFVLQVVGTGIAMLIAADRFGYPGTSAADIAILWLIFCLSTYRQTTIGTQFSLLRAKLSQKNQQLSESVARIEELASHDELTGVLNRRSFMRQVESERARCERSKQHFCVAILDIDHFKRVNDRFGHLAGDLVLKEFCAVVGACMRSADVFARYGGEEFILLLPAPTDMQAALRAAERVRGAIEAHDWGRVTPGATLTVSTGAACWDVGETIEHLLSRADQALYRAKRGGRNRVVADEDTLVAAGR